MTYLIDNRRKNQESKKGSFATYPNNSPPLIN
uniref:Uncharacterized protein n=1 Tax=Myoviridae sp. ctwwN25 TaxID=2825209 RepID=A0A8S5PPW4_9CAUD|nr:MAG TPA: hypothetical protein [Myoviridae sp. ctwwN25]